MSDKYNKEEPSILQRIQNKTGCLFLVIGIAMLAFVLSDLMSSNGALFGSSQNALGQIAGQDIQRKDFDNRYQMIQSNALQNNPQLKLDEATKETFRQQTWNQMVDDLVKKTEYKKLGLGIGDEEMMDITIGNNTHPQIQQSFKNPETQAFDKARFIQFITEDVDLDPEKKDAWNRFERQFRDIVIEEKYNKLIEKSFYTTDLEARVNYEMGAVTRNASIVNVPYASIPDSTINVTDADIRSYISARSEEYKQEASRDIEYVSFDLIPSPQDTADLFARMAEMKADFANATGSDSSYVSMQSSETPFSGRMESRGSYPPDLEDRIFQAAKGEVFGPILNNGLYGLYKVVETGTDSLPSVRVSHITFNATGANGIAEAEKKAREMKSKIQRGETTFAQAAASNRDGSGAKGGDMGYIRAAGYGVDQAFIDRMLISGQGNMVVVTTGNTVHLAKATSPVSRKTVKVATLSRKLSLSTNTNRKYYSQAGAFKTSLGGEKSFEEVAESKEFNLTKKIALNINEDERRVTGLENGNIVASWLFSDERKEGDVSNIMTIGNKYVIARLTKIKEEGLPKVEDIRDEVEVLVRNEKKSKILVKKIEEALGSASDKNDLAKKLETIVTESQVSSFEGANLPYIGKDEAIMGAIFGTPVEKHSGPVVGKNGVAVVYVNNLNKANDGIDMKSKKIELNSNKLNQSRNVLNEALIEKKGVTDRRYRVYNAQ